VGSTFEVTNSMRQTMDHPKTSHGLRDAGKIKRDDLIHPVVQYRRTLPLSAGHTLSRRGLSAMRYSPGRCRARCYGIYIRVAAAVQPAGPATASSWEAA